MPPPKNRWESTPWNPTFRAIATEDRRKILQGSLKWAPTSEKSLAGYLAAADRGSPPPTDERIQSAHMELVHFHLPLLTDVGFLTWDTESGTVETTTHPALSDPRFKHLLSLDSPGVSHTFEALSHEYRRIILTAFWEGETERTVTTLAKKVVHCRDREGSPETASIDEIAIALHHAHLPKLAGRDLIEYDPEASRVVYTGHPVLEEVLTIIYELDDYLTGNLDGFLSGLKASYQSGKPDTDQTARWPHHWRQYHG